MTYAVDFVEAVDLATIATIQWSALRDNPLIQTLYPRGPTSELVEFTAASYERTRTYPSVRIVKATDDETGQIVAFAKWIVYNDHEQQSDQVDVEGEVDKDDPVVREWSNKEAKTQKPPPHCYTRALNDWNNRIVKMRKSILDHRNHSCVSRSKHSLSCYFACFSMSLHVLDILHTHPSQQGKGAGACLVQWGTDMADKNGSQCYVETPVAGYSLFRRTGFQNVAEMSLDLGQYKEGQTTYKHLVMLRPPYGLSQPERPPPIPPKNDTESERSLAEDDPIWDASEAGEDESPTLQYTAEAKMLHLSSSTESPKLGSVAAMRASASTRDLRQSISTSSRLDSSSDVRVTSSINNPRSPSPQQEEFAKHKEVSMREMGYSFSAKDLNKSLSPAHEKKLH